MSPHRFNCTRRKSKPQGLFTVKMKGCLITQDGIATYNKFMQSGRPLNKSEHPDLDKKYFTNLTNFLLPVVVPNEAIYLSYLSKLKAK